jgi:hypothetical protein
MHQDRDTVRARVAILCVHACGQDHDRAVVVGETSFGKGLVQRLRRLPAGAVVKFTAGRYYTPSGRCIQSTVYKGPGGSGPAGAAALGTAVKAADRRVFRTDAGRPVRDGGGIDPDVPAPQRPPSLLAAALARHDAFFRSGRAAGAAGATDGGVGDCLRGGIGGRHRGGVEAA